MKNSPRLLPPARARAGGGGFVGRAKKLPKSGGKAGARTSGKTSKTLPYCEQSKRLAQYIVLYS